MSKNQNVKNIENAISLGQYHFGENYLQESIQKIKKLQYNPKIIWHFIGKLQSNKTKQVAKYFSWCQSIDREKIALLLNKYRTKNLNPINVLIQIKLDPEPNKNGINIKNYQKIAQNISLMPNLILRGIMVMPSIKKNIIHRITHYQNIYIIFKNLQKKYPSVDTLSLGTSLDISEALIAKSNMIRIGHSIFKKNDKINKE